MPVRKLNRNGGGDDGGSQPIHVDDSAVDIFVESLLDSQAAAAGGQSKAAQGGGDGKGQKADKDQEQQCAWPQAPSKSRLQQSAADVIAALHEAKQELAKEMEANLKQLKAVLQETQRIAKDMEAVLGEAKGQPQQDQSDEERQGRSARGKQEPWNPPTLKQKAEQDQEESDDQGDQDQQSDDDDGQQQSPPEWEPPVDLHAQH